MLDLRRIALCAFLATLLAAPSAAQEGTGAQCTLTFDATWSAPTHPVDFPPDPHFSPLIGGTHNDQVVYWQGGMLASPGVRVVAETGATGTFRSEILQQISAGTTDAVVSGGPIGTSPGRATANFTIDLDHPLLTAITMIAPSPDWFVGVHGLPLFENGSWIEQLVLQLPAYDAGTDSGMTFTSGNLVTVPAVPIFEITGPPFMGGTSMGTFTVDCTSSLLFLDGFESEDTAAWSSSVGG
ncbi:MAG: spondin domain-containing protein [Acidobacteriota bacterium]